MHNALDLRILTGDIHCFLNKLIILFRSAYYLRLGEIELGIQGKQTESVGEREGRGLNFEKKIWPHFYCCLYYGFIFF